MCWASLQLHTRTGNMLPAAAQSLTVWLLSQVSTDESDRLIKMEDTLHTRVIGQEEAVVAIARAIRRARVGLKNPNRPIASFIFSGPTGTHHATAWSTAAATAYATACLIAGCQPAQFPSSFSSWLNAALMSSHQICAGLSSSQVAHVSRSLG